MFSNEIVGALGVSFLWGMVPLIHMRLMQKMNRITVFAIEAFLYFLCIDAIIIYHYDMIKKDLLDESTWDLFLLMLSIVIIGVSADLLYLYVLENNKNPFILPIVYCGPIFTMTLSYLLTKKKSDSIYGLLGVFLIMSGIICISLHE
jgi:drug/metabolite transporter (DMT)-like permease